MKSFSRREKSSEGNISCLACRVVALTKIGVAALEWLRCGESAFIAFIGIVLYPRIRVFSVFSVSSVVKNIAFKITVV